VPRRSDSLTAKSCFCDPKLELQAKRVMLRKWQPGSVGASRTSPTTPDASIAARFHETFKEPLSSSKKAAMRELFPMAAARRRVLSTGLLNVASRIISFLVSYDIVCSTA
jgi:hypothetical protein